MADEQDRWLDRETAEILLRGESPEAVDPAARDRAARLARALGALSAPPVPSSTELPGEAAALAAFREARAERADARAGTSDAPGHDAVPQPSDAGLVRIAPRAGGARRPRWSRPLRLGLAAALTVGMVGSVAVAAGTGVLPTPFDGAEAEPGATVSAAASPDRPLASPSPPAGARGGPAPGGPGSGDPDRSGAGSDAGGGTAEGRDSGSRSDADDRADGSPGGRPGLTASCRDMGAGQELEGTRRRALKEAAGGSSRVGTYCRNLLAGTDGAAQDRSSGRTGSDSDESGKTPRERETEKETGDSDDKGDKGGRGNEGGKGGEGDQEGEGGEKKGDGDKGGKDGKDDDGPHITPPAGHHRVPHAPSALVPLPQQRPNHPPHAPHASSAVINDFRPALSQSWNGSLAEGVTLSAALAQ
ncbi:hypothetical protein GCM10022384_42750 [Streptomyces marokkonensis]|uniref:Extensin n=1 Tax=Streptomyces marokkonensis TaxID=324855 RepID=A0ABP7QZ52_9ACTN